MDAARQYVISITACAIIGGMVMRLAPKGVCRDLLRILYGLILAFTLIEPIPSLRLEKLDIPQLWDTSAGEKYAEDGSQSSRAALGSVIQEQAEKYIIEKAEALGVGIQVTVYLGNGAYPVPEAVAIQGNIPLAIKKELEALIENDLGITKEYQTWKE